MEVIAILSEDQKIATQCDGPALVLSSAGSGKTRTLTHRVYYLLSKGVPAAQLLILAFTNKAAKEISNRMKRSLPWLGTFHSCSLRMLKCHLDYLDYRKYIIYNDRKSLTLIKHILRDRSKNHDPLMVQRCIKGYKINLLHPQDIEDAEMASIYKTYEMRLQEMSAFDFEDMIKRTVELLRDYKEVRCYYQSIFRYILVDEFQDTNYSQYTLLKLLAPPENNLFLVGDPDQSIYQFRGADIQYIQRFQKDYPSGALFKLEENFRNTKTIVNASNEVIRVNNSLKESYTMNKKGLPIVIYSAWDEEEEVHYVVESIRGSSGDIAVLCRTHRLLRYLEMELVKESIPYSLYGGRRLFQRKEILDILSLLHLSLKPTYGPHLFRVIEHISGVGKEGLRSLFYSSKEEGNDFLEILGKVSDDEGLNRQRKEGWHELYHLLQYLSHLHKETTLLAKVEKALKIYQSLLQDAEIISKDSIQAFIAYCQQYEAHSFDPSLSLFLEDISLYCEEQPKVHLMTVHGAKGLEFSKVFVMGVEEDLFPHLLAKQDGQLEEERRLFYVAMTRAKERLYLSHCRYRNMYGDLRAMEPSRFLREIPQEYVEEYKEKVI